MAQFPVLYLLLDASGSTVLEHFNLGCNQALPGLVATIEHGWGGAARIGVLSYGSTATVRVPLTAVANLVMIPELPAAGLSSMAAGFRLLAQTIEADRHQLTADALAHADPTIVVVADGPPTDAEPELIDARNQLDSVAAAPPDVHLVVPTGTDTRSLDRLRVTRHRLDTHAPKRLADSLVSVVGTIVSGLPG
jgi:uncharacterized protein YegL